jgi:hypothetical protein
MDDHRFDALTRLLTAAGSRRSLIGMLAGATFGVAPGGMDITSARKRKRKKKRKKNQNQLPAQVCTPACAGRTCGDDGCGGSCGNCGDGFLCLDGTCQCPAGQEACGGACLSTCPPGPFSFSMTIRNPVTCGCCLPTDALFCESPADCCSGICQDAGSFTQCQPLRPGDPCTFGAQCASGRCEDGVCEA